MRTLTLERLQQQIDGAFERWCSKHVRVDRELRVVHLPERLRWYAADYGVGEHARDCQALLRHVNAVLHFCDEAALADFTAQFTPCDWTFRYEFCAHERC